MALFTVQSSTVGSVGNARLTVLAETLERDTRTVMQVRIPVHGADDWQVEASGLVGAAVPS